MSGTEPGINTDMVQGFHTLIHEPRQWLLNARVMREHPTLGQGLPPENGPWITEPDEARWRDIPTGYQCWAKRHTYGNWCGYVQVPRVHRLHGLDYNEPFRPALPDEDVWETSVEGSVQVHGGITYAGTWMSDGDWWFGFDCAHAWDIQPGLMAFEDSEWRSLPYVVLNCHQLAQQLKVFE